MQRYMKRNKEIDCMLNKLFDKKKKENRNSIHFSVNLENIDYFLMSKKKKEDKNSKKLDFK